MYIRIDFENLESEETGDTLMLLTGSPSGTCLSSTNAFQVCRTYDGRSYYWYLDDDVISKHYHGVASGVFDHLGSYPGVKSVNLLLVNPLPNPPRTAEDFDNLSDIVKSSNVIAARC